MAVASVTVRHTSCGAEQFGLVGTSPPRRRGLDHTATPPSHVHRRRPRPGPTFARPRTRRGRWGIWSRKARAGPRAVRLTGRARARRQGRPQAIEPSWRPTVRAAPWSLGVSLQGARFRRNCSQRPVRARGRVVSGGSSAPIVPEATFRERVARRYDGRSRYRGPTTSSNRGRKLDGVRSIGRRRSGRCGPWFRAVGRIASRGERGPPAPGRRTLPPPSTLRRVGSVVRLSG